MEMKREKGTEGFYGQGKLNSHIQGAFLLPIDVQCHIMASNVITCLDHFGIGCFRRSELINKGDRRAVMLHETMVNK